MNGISSYQSMLRALADSRTVVLSLLRQLNLHNVNETQLQQLVRQCAIDLVHRKPVIQAALKRTPRRRNAKSK
jgi:hypothetical protein